MSSLRVLARSGLRLQHGARPVRSLASPVCRPGSVAFFSTEDSHDDFKPQIKGDSSKPVAEQIKDDVTSNPVFIYMKGYPDRPMCGFSNMACRILDAHDVPYGSRDVLADPELREGIKQYTHWPTIPQVFIGGEFVGGSDILYQMHQDGELEKQLKAAFETASKPQ